MPGDDGRVGARCESVATWARASRQGIIDALVANRVLWPLIDHAPSCRLCATPRQSPQARDNAYCHSCHELVRHYDHSLADLYPITYTTPQWALCSAIRALKDIHHAGADNPLARTIGAILSAYLEAHLTGGRLGLPRKVGIVTTVPSSRPVIAAALRRAAQEGWWSPELAAVAIARPGHRRQRERPDAQRPYIRDKWDVDREAVNGLDVLVLDDVYTSGGSIHSFAHALRTAGATSVRAVILARNLRDDGAWALPLLRAHHDAGRPWTPTANKHDALSPDRLGTSPRDWRSA